MRGRSWLEKGWNNLKGKAIRATGKITKAIGEFTGSERIKEKGQEWQEKGEWILQETAERAGETASFDRDKATIGQTVAVNDILTSFLSGWEGLCREKEDRVKEQVSQVFAIIIKQLDENFKENTITLSLQRKQERIVRSIEEKHPLCSHLSTRVSMQDHECMKIMGMAQGKEKQQAMAAFGAKVIQEGLDNLCDWLKKAMAKIQEATSGELNAMVDAQRQQLENYIAQSQEILERKQDTQADQQSAMLPPAQGLAASEVALEVLEGTTL